MSPYARRLPELIRNLRHLYKTQTTDVDRYLGRRWYPNAHLICRDWADTYNYSLSTVACVVAVLSPQCEWSRNLIIADDLLAGRQPSTHGALLINVAKAERIRDQRLTNTLDVMPGGPKVASFACNLAGDYRHATIDTHAAQAALGDVESNVRLTWLHYAVFAAAYEQTAKSLRYEPAHFQATIWHTWKRIYPRVLKSQLRQQWHVMGETL